MTSHNLNAVMSTLRQLPLDKAAISYGIAEADLRTLMSEHVWHSPAIRLRVRQTLESVALGSLDAMGLPRVELPAEIIAQWISVLVSPNNWLAACAFFGRPRTADQIIEQDDLQLPGITPQRLFALVVKIHSADTLQRHDLRNDCLAAIGQAPELIDQEPSK